MSDSVAIRVGIVDDQPMVRAGFGALVAAQPDMEVVMSASDGVEAVALAHTERPDVILMDIRMPRLDGLQAMQQIFEAALTPEPRVIVLTTFDADNYVFAALRGGASGFLLKDAEIEELIGAVRTVHAGGALLSPAITKKVIADFTATVPTRGPSPELQAQVASLTERECEVVRLISSGLSNQEIGARMFLAEPTIKTHVSHILQKLRLRDRTQIVIAAYESGLVEVGAGGASR
ncbi:MAG: response regulator transcription factor [Dermabacter sp.]|nr:response regulator transcription factor [Dermabacter sp.]